MNTTNPLAAAVSFPVLYRDFQTKRTTAAFAARRGLRVEPSPTPPWDYRKGQSRP